MPAIEMARWCLYCCVTKRQIHPLENVVDLYTVDITDQEVSDSPEDVQDVVSLLEILDQFKL